MLSGLSGYIKGVKNALHGTATAAKPTLGRVRVGNRDIEEIKLISQGGYAYVFEVRDMSTGEIFALKKMICQSPERFETAKNEIRMLRSLPDHPNLLRVFDTSIENRDNCYYVYVLLEFCDGGSIFDLMAKHESTKLNEKQLIFIMREVCEGVKALHSKKPPIAHRDLKIENVLLRNKRFKLCDFGSCSTSYVDFSKIPQSQYATYEEEYEKNTTLMYRPPEMCDPYQRQIVCEKVDIWMLGCILYTMCFYKHPFQEMTKLSIVNAAYTFPEDHPYPEKLIDLIRIMLTPNPNYRPSIYDVSELFNNYFDLKSVKLNPDAQRIREDQRKNAMEMKKFQNSNPRLKFDGDIPIEELMKLQKSLQDDDESPVHQFNQRGNGNGNGYGNRQQQQQQQQKQQQQPQQFKQHSSKPNIHHFDSFDSFGQPPKKPQQPELHQFNSSPGLHQSNNDWADFKNLNNNSTPKTNNQWNGFGNNNAQPKPSSFSNNQGNGNQGNHGNQGWSNNQNSQPVKTDNRVNEQWNNFNFNSTPANTQTNNNNSNNNSANQWATSGWGTQNQNQNQNQNQQQAQNFNAFNSTPSSNSQANNAWNNFGANSNNNMSNQNNFQNNFQSNNNNMMNQPQKANTVVTNDLLDLADTSNNGKPNIMALYAMNR